MRLDGRRGSLDFRGQTVVCIASGPSLTVDDCERFRDFSTIVTNTTFRLCPWASVLYWFDLEWWRDYAAEVREKFTGRIFTQQRVSRRGVECARANLGFRSFGNAGANAASLAISAGAPQVILLGYDCGLTNGRSHHHGDHPGSLRNCDTLPRWPTQFERLAAYAKRRGVEVVNMSRSTTLTCFPRGELH